MFSYSNVGYLLAGHLVEEVTGLDWAEAVESVLLRPLGITPAFVVGAAGSRGVVCGHVLTDDRVLPVAEQVMPEVEAPNGALALSSADLLAFAALFSANSPAPDVLDPATAALMCQDQLADVRVGPYGMADGWGLGWARYRGAGADWFGHDGTGDGTSCHLRFDPERGTAVALTTNGSTGAALWRELCAELAERHVLPPEWGREPGEATPVAGPPDGAGHYANGPAEFVVTRQDDDGLALVLDGAQAVPLTCLPDLRFQLRLGTTVLSGRFLRDPDTGGIDHIQVTGRLARRRQVTG